MTKPYIERQRSELDNRKLYEHLEWLVKRYKAQKPSWWCVWYFCRFIRQKTVKAA